MALLRTAITVYVTLSMCANTIYGQASFEYQLKAAFLFRFTEFVEWPAAAFSTAQSPIRICVLGSDPFRDALDRTVEGQRVHGRNVVPVRMRRIDQVSGCNIVFISRSEANRAADILMRLRGSPVLTVADMDNFLQLGGTINFVTEGGRIRFDISMGSAQRGQLQLSSKLLRLARTVRRAG